MRPYLSRLVLLLLAVLLFFLCSLTSLMLDKLKELDLSRPSAQSERRPAPPWLQPAPKWEV